MMSDGAPFCHLLSLKLMPMGHAETTSRPSMRSLPSGFAEVVFTLLPMHRASMSRPPSHCCSVPFAILLQALRPTAPQHTNSTPQLRHLLASNGPQRRITAPRRPAMSTSSGKAAQGSHGRSNIASLLQSLPCLSVALRCDYDVLLLE
jgi:hypothetical protein